MKLSEYMEQYNRKVLNKIEAKAFGIKEMTKGWPKRYADLEVSDDMLKLIIDSPSCSKATRKIRKKLSKKIDFVKKYETTDEKLLYLMQNSNGLCKIGISVDPIKRARTLSTAGGVNVFLIVAWKLDKNARTVENMLHKRFDKYRLEGEWFTPNNLTPEAIEAKIDCNYERVYECSLSEFKRIDRQYITHKYSEVKYQTEKAILFVIDGNEVWCPKSRIHHMDSENQEIKVPAGQFD